MPCIQHEIDHLNGILFIDHISKLKRDIIWRKVLRGTPDLVLILFGEPMRYIYGSPIFAVKSLDALHRHHEVLCLYSATTPSRRGMQVRPTAVAEYLKSITLPVMSPVT